MDGGGPAGVVLVGGGAGGGLFLVLCFYSITRGKSRDHRFTGRSSPQERTRGDSVYNNRGPPAAPRKARNRQQRDPAAGQRAGGGASVTTGHCGGPSFVDTGPPTAPQRAGGGARTHANKRRLVDSVLPLSCLLETRARIPVNTLFNPPGTTHWGY